MAVDTPKPAASDKATSASPAAGVKQPAAKPAARPRTTRAAVPAPQAPAGKRTPVAAKKTTARPAVRKSPPAKKASHEPEVFVAKSNKAAKPVKVKKAKLVRDSFTMPDGEYALIASLKKRCLDAGIAAKKSEILRAAVANLAKLSDASVVSAVRRLETIKTGRPAKNAK
jgi:hypothetical protein